MWTQDYSNLINRNIGLLTEDQQNILQETCIAVFGLGGLGGVIAEVLARSGVGSLKIVDNDKFDPTNLNRQVFAYTDTVGKMKTDVTEECLKKINPEIKIEKFTEINTQNAGVILSGARVAMLAIDTAKPCLIISRAARKLNIPLVEGWAIPFGNVRVFTSSSPSLEECYNFPTINKDIDAISEQDLAGLKLQMFAELKHIEGLEDFYPHFAVERIVCGQIPSFAPVVWLTAVLMSLEALKIVLHKGKISVAPNFALYNPFENKVISPEAK